MFVEKHFEKFKECLPGDLDPNDISKRTATDFWASLPDVVSSGLPRGKISREKVFELAENRNIPTVNVCVAAMIWGGMDERYADLAFRKSDRQWLEICNEMRFGSLQRDKAYVALKASRASKTFKGMGPAYFTKLIYFLLPRTLESENRGYIMDQWVGCSVNLLKGSEIVKMNSSFNWAEKKKMGITKGSNFTVADINSSTDYKLFSETIAALANSLNLSPDYVDRALISNGGRRKASWRQYVIDHRVP